MAFGKSFSGPRWLLICFLLSSLLPMALAQIIQPSNSTLDHHATSTLRYNIDDKHTWRQNSTDLAPLTPSLIHYTYTEFETQGTLRNVDPANAGDLSNSDIAFVCCDDSAYSGNLDANDTIKTVITSTSPVAAVVLYSTESQHCNYTSDPEMPEFENIFTLLDPDSAMWIRDRLDSTGGSEASSILPDMSSTTEVGSGGGRNSGLFSPGSTEGPLPTTLAAMIILYSITGIITALFLGIIITGAIRAHRHPERYGPRTGTGRPRQSRARGLARAMLETIPIVKFGDQDDANRDVSGKLDVEMAAGHDGNDANDSPEANNQTSAGDDTVHGGLNERNVADPVKDNEGADVPPTAATTEATPPDAASAHIGSLGCSICTDDFIKGQDIRVLPCNHKFHPECVDPWLVNVSGTCPLCRIDLNPSLSDHEDPEEGAGTNPDPSLGETVAQDDRLGTHHRWGLSSYIHGTLNARRMRDASVEERIATLRRLRRAQQNNDNTTTTTTETQTPEHASRRNRLSTRFRDSFRIRTGQHGDDSAPTPAPASGT